jgi:superoxide dismutase, Cu-Zn family
MLMRTATLLVLTAALVMAGGAIRADAQSARAELKDAKGGEVGTVMFTESDSGVRIEIDITRLAPGTHAFHLHEKGACDAPDFKSAGGHYNPTGKKHGFLHPEGPHAGDLPNITVGADSTLKMTMTTKLVTLEKGAKTSLLLEGGTAVVIHQGADDYLSQPAGAGGPRIACGVIAEVKAPGGDKKSKSGK